MADGSTYWNSFFYISIPNSNGTGNFVPRYNYTDETGLKFLLEGNVSINVQYSTGHGSKVGLLVPSFFSYRFYLKYVLSCRFPILYGCQRRSLLIKHTTHHLKW